MARRARPPWLPGAAYVWAKDQEDCISREITYLAGQGKDDTRIDRWLFVAPQLQNKGETWSVGNREFTVKIRSRVDEQGRFKVYSEPAHRAIAKVVAGTVEARHPSTVLRKLGGSRTAVLCFYPVKDRGDKFVSMGYALQFPSNGQAKELRFGALADLVG